MHLKKMKFPLIKLMEHPSKTAYSEYFRLNSYSSIGLVRDIVLMTRSSLIIKVQRYLILLVIYQFSLAKRCFLKILCYKLCRWDGDYSYFTFKRTVSINIRGLYFSTL